MIIIATFFSHFGAIRFKKQCGAAGWEARMKPVPRALSSSCGTCVEYSIDWPEANQCDFGYGKPDQSEAEGLEPDRDIADQYGVEADCDISDQYRLKRSEAGNQADAGWDRLGQNGSGRNKAAGYGKAIREVNEASVVFLPKEFVREEVEQAVLVTPEGYSWIYRAEGI